MRLPKSPETAISQSDSSGNVRTPENLFMDGAEIFAFTLASVPKLVNEVLARAGKTKEDVGLFVFHQPNRYMLESIRKQLKIDPERFAIYLEDCGNTVSATIPIALKRAQEEQRLKPGTLVLLAGFGVGYSWAGTLVEWAV